MSQNEIYLGNPNLKKANTPVEFSKENVKEYLKCKNDPVYFAKNYVKIVSLMKVLFRSICTTSKRS